MEDITSRMAIGTDLSDIAPFWTSPPQFRLGARRIFDRLSLAGWVSRICPGVGHDRFRLVTPAAFIASNRSEPGANRASAAHAALRSLVPWNPG